MSTLAGNASEASDDSAAELLNELNLDVSSIKPTGSIRQEQTLKVKPLQNVQDETCRL